MTDKLMSNAMTDRLVSNAMTDRPELQGDRLGRAAYVPFKLQHSCTMGTLKDEHQPGGL